MPIVQRRRPSHPVIAANMPFVALYPSGRLALWGLRYWATCARRGRCPALLLRDVYLSAGVEGAPLRIDALMRVFAYAARHPPQLGCPACTRLTDDEAALLNAMRSVQNGDVVDVEALLSTWLPLHAARVAAPSLVDYARLLRGAGYALSSAAVPLMVRMPQGASLH
ncbi:hypothetical protein [Niveispirillum fermenti]|uniref:hypothetical protein n=1 Tax=Niveispirillum fermenti TaxID=1233113 RepID=UPI003A8962A7